MPIVNRMGDKQCRQDMSNRLTTVDVHQLILGVTYGSLLGHLP